MVSRVKRYFLEIKDFSNTIDLNLPENYKIVLDNKDNFHLNKFFYKQIGLDHFWRDRLLWSDSEWVKYVTNKNLETHVLKKGEDLVTIGIQPSFAETGFGYIEADTKGLNANGDQRVFPVKAFKEKPNLKTAEYFLEQGNYFWNSGMFVWKASKVLQEIQAHLPMMYDLLERAKPEFGTDLEAAAIKDFYHECESISIDYGIMEKAASVKVIPGDFGWNDVGSWSAVYELSEKDKKSNALQALNYCLVDSNNNLIFSKSEKMMALVGVENMAVVETEKALLICDLRNAQGVKQVVEQLKASQELKSFS